MRLLASGITLLVGMAGLRAQDAYGSPVARDTASGNLEAEAPENAGFLRIQPLCRRDTAG
ncbi:MAG TPA: hypothetical protein VKB61_11570 [Candidatus Acidoferrum sp.]|nr:hypothetical protein [Candidatus Acidoferrum sp.]